MSFPVFLSVGGRRLHPHIVFEVLAYFVGLCCYLWLRRRRGDHLTAHARWSVLVAAIVGGAIGSRALYWLEDPDATFRHWNDAVFLMSGKTVVGGLVGGLIAVEWVKAHLGIMRATGDLLAVPLAIGIAVGRVGCFLTGLEDRTYGVATTLPWGVDFGDGIARHPTALYESAFLVVLTVVLAWLMRRPLVEGLLFKIFILTYMGFRLVIDVLKPDLRIVVGLSAIQCVCLLTFAYYARISWEERYLNV